MDLSYGNMIEEIFMNFVEIGLLNCRILLLYYIILICYGLLLFENLVMYFY